MRFNRLHGAILAVLMLMVGSFVLVNLAPVAHAQSATTGAISGDVKDPSGALVPNAKVTLVNMATNATLVVTSNSLGRYTASQLLAGHYKVSATAQNLQSNASDVEVLIQTTVSADLTVTPTGKKEVVEVTASTLPLVDTQNVALATTFNEKQIEDLPTPGGDVTTVAFTAPGVELNASSSFGYGNFSANGLPGISNLFVLNGFDNQDPFLNLNNSGSSNLTLGQGELAEATVVENGYNSQYGRAAGVTINYTTKSGGNAFHGEADYNWNGSILNANGWFFNHTNTPRPHAVSNEWAANGGGPIIKDKVFFFVDYEGLNYVLPGGAGYANFPSPKLQSFLPYNYAQNGANIDLLTNLLAQYTNSPAYAAAKDIGPASCGDLTGTVDPVNGGTFGVDESCMVQTFGSANNINKEWLNTDRIDWQISDRQRVFGRFKVDHGTQPTYTNFVNPAFNTVSIQPEYEGQLNHSYQITPNMSNVFIMAANWYTAYFGPASVSASQATFPWFDIPDLGLDGSGNGSAAGLGQVGVPNAFPQGRNVTQYQFQDDFDWTKNKHNFKFGFNFRRDLLSVYDAQANTDFPLTYGYFLSTFANGYLQGDGLFNQNYITNLTAHLKLYNIGIYAQDEWQVNNKLKLTMGIRVDRTGNPNCQGSCFGEYVSGTFPSGNASINQAYSLAAGGSINPALSSAFKSMQAISVQPRFGFNYSVDDKTEFRGGIGLFADLYPGVILDPVVQNFPNDNSINIFFGNLDLPGGDPNSVQGNATAANGLLITGFNGGQSLTQINNNILTKTGVPFTPPQIGAYFPGKFQTPTYLEYNFQLQRALTRDMAVIINYTGNYGYNELIQNPWLNAGTGFFDAAGVQNGNWTSFNGNNNNPSIVGVPLTPPDPSFSRVNSFTNDARSNFNGGWIALKYNGHGLTAQFNFNYGHALDEISNAGVGASEPFNTSSLNGQLTTSLSNYNLNYSNADYDLRKNFTGDFDYVEPLKFSNPIVNSIVAGWTLGGKVYFRSGLPFSVTNTQLTGFSFQAMGPNIMGQAMVPVNQITNTCGSNPHNAVPNTTNGAIVSCIDGSAFAGFTSGGVYTGASGTTVQNTLGNVRRNTFYGPGYKDVDLSLVKSLYKHNSIDFKIGANVYNLFNNVNFGNPGGGLGSSTFGGITATIAAPTSPYGSFQGSGVTQRLLQLHGKFTF